MPTYRIDLNWHVNIEKQLFKYIEAKMEIGNFRKCLSIFEKVVGIEKKIRSKKVLKAFMVAGLSREVRWVI